MAEISEVALGDPVEIAGHFAVQRFGGLQDARWAQRERVGGTQWQDTHGAPW